MQKIIEFSRLLRPYRGFLVRAISVALILNLLEIPIPYLTKELIDSVYPNRDGGLMTAIVLGIFLISLFNVIVGVVNNYYVSLGGVSISLDLKYKLLRRIMHQSFSFFDRIEVGDILSRFQDTDEAINSTVSIMAAFVMNLISLLIFPAVLFAINWKLTLLALMILPFDIVITMVSNRYIKRLRERLARTNAKNLARKVEFIEGIRVIQSLGVQDKGFKELRGGFENAKALGLGSELVQCSSGLLTGMLSSLGTMLFTYVGWVAILGNELSLGTFLAFSMYIGHLYGPMKSMIGLTQQLQIAIVYSSRFFEIYNNVPEVMDNPSSVALSRCRGRITFHEVGFGYEPDKPVLQDISFEVSAGQTVALVSHSGGGKSTVLGLIPRFYDIDQGQILVDNIDVRDYRLGDLRRQIGFVWQEPEIFSGTILENILLGRGKADREEVVAAARMANAHEFIARLPEQYDTEVGENGVGLSVGQRQRICLARVLLLDTPIILFDEVTSALDADSEEKITRVIQRLKGDKTMLIVAHRLSTVKHADQIIVLEGGGIAEQGTHRELMSRAGGLYRGLYEKQQGVATSREEATQVCGPPASALAR